MLTAILVAASPFFLNSAMEFVKWLTSVSSTGGKRFLLAVLSILGVISYSAVTGSPLDVGNLTSLVQLAAEALLAFFAAHGTYSLLKTTPVPNA